jgi:hypothetical protein
MTDDERSKRPTIKTMPEAPSAKARETPQPARTITERGSAPGGSTPERGSQRSHAPTERGSPAPERSNAPTERGNAPAVSLDTDKGVGPAKPTSYPPATRTTSQAAPTSKPASHPPQGAPTSKPASYPPTSKPASKPPLAREPGGNETSLERPRGFRAQTPTTEPEVRDSMEDMHTHVFDSGKFQRREQGNVNDTIKDSDNVMPVSGPHAPPAFIPSNTAEALPPAPLPPRPMPVQAKVTARAAEMVQPPQVVARSRMVDESGDFKREVATPVKAISMKTPGDIRERVDTPPRALPQVKLRSMDEVRGERAQSPPAQSLGYLAPPRDAAEVRARRRGEIAIWASVCVILACAVALGIWFLAK